MSLVVYHRPQLEVQGTPLQIFVPLQRVNKVSQSMVPHVHVTPTLPYKFAIIEDVILHDHTIPTFRV